MLTDVQIMLEALTDMLASGDMPDVQFKTNNSIYDEVAVVTGVANVSPTTESDNARLTRWVEEIVACLNGGELAEPIAIDELNTITNETIQDVATAFAEKISVATASLQQIHTEVAGLTERIVQRQNQLTAMDPFLSQHVEVDPDNIEFATFPFEVLKACGNTTALNAHVLDVVGRSDDAQNRPQMVNVVDRFANLRLGMDNLQPITLEKEALAAMVDAINLANEDILPEAVTEVMKVASYPSALTTLAARMVRTMKTTEPTQACLAVIDVIANYRVIMPQVQLTLEKQDATSAVTDACATVVQYVEDMTDICAYYVQWHRVNTFSKTILMSDRSLNPDLTGQLEKQNCNLADVARHIRSHYVGAQLPTTGIIIDTVVSNKERLEDKELKQASSDKMRVESARKIVREKAFVAVMTEFGVNSGMYGSKSAAKTFAQHKATYLSTKGIACEDLLYTIIMEKLHKGEFVAVLYRELSLSYVKAIGENKNLSASEIEMANIGIYAKLIASFLYDTFMEEGEDYED